MNTRKRFEDETEYWLQQLFEAWDDVFQAGGWFAVNALELVGDINLGNEYSQHIEETWD